MSDIKPEWTDNPTVSGVSLCNTDILNDDLMYLKRRFDTQITNCLLEVPQRIKVEIVDDSVVLKAGSVVTVPNGVGVFDYVTVESDVTLGPIGTYTGDCMFFLSSSGKTIVQYIMTESTSGTTAPTGNGGWYDTTNNLVKAYSAGADTGVRLSLPFAMVHRTSGTWDEIKQVFNGIGNIGLKIWLDKDVKMLVADGLNDDGSIKNKEITIPNTLFSLNNAGDNNIPFFRIHPTLGTNQIYAISATNFLGNLDYVPTVGSTFQWYFNTNEMKWYMHEVGGTEWTAAPYYNISLPVTVSNGIITSFKPYKAFRAMDQTDFDNLQTQINAKVSSPIDTICTTVPGTTSTASTKNAVIVTENYRSGTSFIQVNSDGWCIQGGVLAAGSNTWTTATLLRGYNNTNYHVFINGRSASGSGNNATFQYECAAPATATTFKYYAIGYTQSWLAFGYIT